MGNSESTSFAWKDSSEDARVDENNATETTTDLLNKRKQKKKHFCIIEPNWAERGQILDRKSIRRLVWCLEKRLRMKWKLIFDSDRDGVSFTKLTSVLGSTVCTQFALAVQVLLKKGEEKGEKRSTFVFGACVVFEKGKGLVCNRTEYQGERESYLFTVDTGDERNSMKKYNSTGIDKNICWLCRDLASERFPNGLAFGGRSYPQHFAMHVDENLELLTVRKTSQTFVRWGDDNENEQYAIQRVEVWQMDCEDDRGERKVVKNNALRAIDGISVARENEIKEREGEGGVLSEKHREARFMAQISSTKIESSSYH